MQWLNNNAIMISSFLFSAVLFLLFFICNVSGTCLREQSRTVRRVVNQEMLTAFSSFERPVDIPRRCPFRPDLDFYLQQEKHKTMETVSRWACDYCGKAFTNEYFLDLHFDNRHADKLHVSKSKNTVCLSDYCDIFRCDVVSSRNKVDYWQIALCIEDDLAELKTKCKAIMDLCIPKSVSKNTSDVITDALYTGVCSYLTCDAYWETPFPQESQTEQILYVMACVFVIFILIMYYCVILNYYYSDDWEPQSYDWHQTSHEQMQWRPRSQYDPALAAQQKPKVVATRRKAVHSAAKS